MIDSFSSHVFHCPGLCGVRRINDAKEITAIDHQNPRGRRHPTASNLTKLQLPRYPDHPHSPHLHSPRLFTSHKRGYITAAAHNLHARSYHTCDFSFAHHVRSVASARGKWIMHRHRHG